MTLGLPLAAMIAFLLVLARVAGVIAFLPIPGFRAAPMPVRAALAMAIAFCLFPVWPRLADALPSFGALAAAACSEAGLGLIIGLAVAFLIEGFQMAAQVLGVQAGYGFASTIDPSSQADSGVLQVLMGLVSGLLFFATGIHREIIRVLGASFEKFPAGSWAPAISSMDGIARLGGGMFTLGLRLAMPVMAMLFLLELALALLGRIAQQLNLLSLSFPVKMLAALAMLVALGPVMAELFEGASGATMSAIWDMLRG
ncbi:MAG TPA: flagellar biosynthetic protein FliR [Bryobacteraceae bacterium]|jgi:flagellar biosynthetic protein FliR|nr:flagellar biosynthetic protein FliR [Bryobacteraceae bacterium]